MFRRLLVVLGVLLMFGCAGWEGMDFNLGDNPIVNHMLVACGSVPVSEFDECVKAEFDNVADGEEMTVAELVQILEDLRALRESGAGAGSDVE